MINCTHMHNGWQLCMSGPQHTPGANTPLLKATFGLACHTSGKVPQFSWYLQNYLISAANKYDFGDTTIQYPYQYNICTFFLHWNLGGLWETLSATALTEETFMTIGGGFFLTCKYFVRMFDHSIPVCAFFFFLTEISLRTLITLFRPGSVHNGSGSWDDCGWVFSDELRVSVVSE